MIIQVKVKFGSILAFTCFLFFLVFSIICIAEIRHILPTVVQLLTLFNFLLHHKQVTVFTKQQVSPGRTATCNNPNANREGNHRRKETIRQINGKEGITDKNDASNC
jgi:hypothetical protein